MTARDLSPTIHASAVTIGSRAVLIRGPSGSGKSRLALDLILAGRAGVIAQAELVGDDRVHLSAESGALVVRPAENLAGLLEVRGLGIRRLPFASEAKVDVVVDLEADDAARLPAANSLEITLNGVKCRRIPVGKGFAALPLLTAMLVSEAL
jgi:serine kinase of HPr protein (carbohydrate metabolism regulator)